MIVFFKNAQGKNHVTLFVFTVIGCFVLLLLALRVHSLDSETTSVSREDVNKLIVTQSDIPFHGILFAFEYSPSPNRGFHELWLGPPGGTLKTAGDSVRVDVSIAPSSEEAAAGIDRLLRGVAEPPREMSAESCTSFGDRAWLSHSNQGGRLLFVRGNVVADIYLSHKDGFDQSLLFSLASCLDRKIDAASEGEPEPVPILPLAADGELRVDLEGAWKMRDLGERLWGAASTTIAIYDGNGIPRSLPAKMLDLDNYIVPLRHLAAIIGNGARVKVSGDEAMTTLMEKEFVFENGESDMRVGERSERLSSPVEFREGEVLVPLTSVLSVGLAKSVEWEQQGSTMIGRVQ